MQHELQFSFILTSLLPIFILIFVFYYLTKKSINKEKSGWKRKFKWASIVAKAATASLSLFYLLLLWGCLYGEGEEGAFSCLFAKSFILPYLILLLIVWVGAFLTSKFIKKENISMLVSTSLIFLIIGAYTSSYINPVIDNFLKQRQIRTIQNSEIAQPSLTPTLIKIDLEAVKDWNKIKVGNASFYIPSNWSISGISTHNHKLVDYIEYKEFYTSTKGIKFTASDYVGIDKIFNATPDINKAIVSFISAEYKQDPQKIKWEYLQKDGVNVGVKITDFDTFRQNIILVAFYTKYDLYTFSFYQENQQVAQEKIDVLVNNTLPYILGTISFDI